MKIGIITIVKVGNYGAELQAYATQAFLKKLGFEAEIIDYLYYKNPDFIWEPTSRASFKLPLVHRLKERLFPLVTKFADIRYSQERKKRNQKFALFHNINTSFSSTFHNFHELKKSTPIYDVYLTGSDQVWNPWNDTSLEPYLLTFAPDEAKRIAFASSFGVEKIPEFAYPFYKSRLAKYDVIGVREKNAVALVKEITGTDAELVLDPTLMLSHQHWQSICSATDISIESGFVLIYELTPCAYIKHIATAWARQLKRPLVRICKNAVAIEKDGSILNITDAGPAEFLWLFDNASAIVTNSFHGSAFAINFNKPFYTIIPARKQNNSRQISLLSLFGLSDRLLLEGAELPDFSEIDFTLPNSILDRERLSSTHFLTTALYEN